MVASIRKQLTDALAPLLPGVKAIPNRRNVDVPDVPFFQVTLREFSHLPAAPQGKNEAEFTVTIVTPLTTPQKAEDDLDALVGDLVAALDGIDWLSWSVATKVLYDDRHLAYDVTVTAITEKN